MQLGVMPLSEAMGTALPLRAPLPVTLLIASVLGVGVTFAEPAIGALQAVGTDVDCRRVGHSYAGYDCVEHTCIGHNFMGPRLCGPYRLSLHRLYLGIADGMPIARVWACRYSK